MMNCSTKCCRELGGKPVLLFVKVVFHFLEFEMFPYSLQLQRKHIGTDVEVERLVMSFVILDHC